MHCPVDSPCPNAVVMPPRVGAPPMSGQQHTPPSNPAQNMPVVQPQQVGAPMPPQPQAQIGGPPPMAQPQFNQVGPGPPPVGRQTRFNQQPGFGHVPNREVQQLQQRRVSFRVIAGVAGSLAFIVGLIIVIVAYYRRKQLRKQVGRQRQK